MIAHVERDVAKAGLASRPGGAELSVLSAS